MSQTIPDLSHRHCKPCETGAPALTDDQIKMLLSDTPGWERIGQEIVKTFKFKNYHETMAFINASAWISHREDHHPDIELGYNSVRVRYSTHSVNGLSENDFICAAKIELLLKI